MQVGGLNFATYDTKRTITPKQYKTDTVVLKLNRKSYALYQMAMFPMTLGDSLPPNHPNFCIFRCPSYLHHRRRTRASPVLTAIGLVNGKPWETVIFHPPQNRHTLTDH